MGPLSGVRVLALRGIGPGPFCGMWLADMGADVIQVQRHGQRPTLMSRGQRAIELDLKSSDDIDYVLKLVERADVLIDPFRPQVTERLGIGPDACLAVNPALVYGRMTGWGQEGPYAARAGHDINYIALSGALSVCGRAGDPPTPPANMLGDLGGGAMFLASGILAALLHARSTGEGQVVDAAMVDGSAYLTAMVHLFMANGGWGPRGTNVVDGGAPYYDVYKTSDGGFLSVGAIEPEFYAQLLDGLGLAEEPFLSGQNDRERWPSMRSRFAERIAERSRHEWVEVFEGRDACAVPVWDLAETVDEPHLAERATYIEVDGVRQPAPAPRFSKSFTPVPTAASPVAMTTADAFDSWPLRRDRLE